MAANILLIEDDDALRAEILDYLLRQKYNVTTCTCIAEAKAALEDATPDTIISDISLPDGDGVSFYVENARRTAGTRWILMSANHDLVRLGNRLKAVSDLPPCSIVVKPLPLRLLDRAIRAAA